MMYHFVFVGRPSDAVSTILLSVMCSGRPMPLQTKTTSNERPPVQDVVGEI